MTSKSSKSAPFDDVRMRGFRRRATVTDALDWLDRHTDVLPPEAIDLGTAAGRILAEDIVSDVDVPAFCRAMMDGFAVHAADTLGATSYNPLKLEIVGQVLPGTAFAGEVRRGQAVRIMTGAPLPAGADAVLPAEATSSENQELVIHGEVAPGKHVGSIGEDIRRQDAVLSRGRWLRPQDLGVLSSIGRGTISVVRRPRVRVVVTGDELSSAGTTPRAHHTVDANSPMLLALIARDGGEALFDGITPDRPKSIRGAMEDPSCDVVIVSGGSSVGQEDHAPKTLAAIGELAIHGIAMRPSSPAGMGRIGRRLVFLLPGNPVSCLCAYDFFAGRAIRMLGDRAADWPYPRRVAKLARKISSVVGRQDYARVTLVGGQVEPIAIAGASVLSSTTRADGFIIISADSEGFPPGAEVEVFLYDQVAVRR